MPITAKLSKQFYERLGEAVTNELVDWFNQVDATYRSELKDLNEANYARFESRLEQRIAELRTDLRIEIGSVRADLVALEARFNAKVESTVAKAIGDQTRFMFTALTTMLVALLVPIIGLWFR
jgi:hypothetical protein